MDNSGGRARKICRIGENFLNLRADVFCKGGIARFSNINKYNHMAKKNEKAAPAAETQEVKADFFTRNSKLIYGILIVIIVGVIAGFLYYRHANKMRTEAANRYAVAVAHLDLAVPHLNGNAQYPIQFRQATGIDSLELRNALEGVDDEMGLLAIVDKYGSRAPEAINLSIASCYLHLGEYENAISYAAKYDTEDPLLTSRALSVKGNAQMQLGQFEAAKASFLAAAGKVDEDIAAEYLFNAALASEELGDLEGALALYTQIRDRYSNNYDQRYPTSGAAEYNVWNIESQIARIETLLAK